MNFKSFFIRNASAPASIDSALKLIEETYQDNTRRNGTLVVDHCKAVWKGLLKNNPNAASLDQQIAALLHDIIEDTQKSTKPTITGETLNQKGYSKKTIKLIQTLTRDKTQEKYINYIRRISKDPDAIDIKIADIQHNSTDLEENNERYIRYQLCMKYLESVKAGEVEPNSIIQKALTLQEIKKHSQIIADHQDETMQVSPEQHP